MNAQHTPTPWTEQDMPRGCNDRITADDGEGKTICEFPYGLNADSAFIVKACNAHDDLVHALQAIANGDGIYGAQANEYKQIARAALAKAKLNWVRGEAA